MCCIIVKPIGVELNKECLRRAFTQNPDGVGYARIENGRVVIRKGVFRKENKVMRFLKRIHKDEPAILHFRMATHGTVQSNLAHPFMTSFGWAMAHNGVFTDMQTGPNRSDTLAFVEDIINPLGAKALENKACEYLLANAIGSSKLAFLNPAGNIKIIGETKGQWKDGLWYSNSNVSSPYVGYTRYQNEAYGVWTKGSHTWKRVYKPANASASATPAKVEDSEEWDVCAYCGKILWSDEEAKQGTCHACKAMVASEDPTCMVCGAPIDMNSPSYDLCSVCYEDAYGMEAIVPAT